MMRGDTGARSATFITSIITSTSNNLRCAGRAPPVSMRPSPGEATLRVRGRPERAATPLAHALYTPLSLPPHLPTPGRSFGHGGNIDREVHRGPPPRSVRRGGQFSTRAYPGHASNTKGPLRRKTCKKTAMTPVVATIRLRRSSPRSRGPPSQSESYVWDKALICRRLGESNSSI